MQNNVSASQSTCLPFFTTVNQVNALLLKHNIISQYQINRSRWRGNINRLLGEIIFPFGPVSIRTEAAGGRSRAV